MFSVGAESFSSLTRITNATGALANALRGQGRLDGVIRGARVFEAEAKRRVPRSTDASAGHEHLADTIGVRLLEHDASVTRASVGTDAPRGVWLEYGTKPHDIVARAKKALWWPGASHALTRVHHPGTSAKPWLGPTLAAKGSEVRDVIAQTILDTARVTGGA